MQEQFNADNLNNIDKGLVTQKTQVDNFPKTTKLLDTKLPDKKDNIKKILWNYELQSLFENNSEFRRKCTADLLSCQNDETKIKEIFLANLPEWYVYVISLDMIVKTDVDEFNNNELNNNFSWALSTDKEWEQAKMDTEQAKEEEAQLRRTIERKKAIENLNIALSERLKLTERYENLDVLTNENSDNYVATKHKLENDGVLNQLKESDYDEQFINKFILVQTTLHELKSNSANYSQDDISLFDKIVKNLNNACNIPDTSFDSFKENNIANTRTELFHETVWNKWLIEQKQRNIESHRSYYERLFRVESDDELIQNYWRFLDGDWKRLMEKWLTNPLSLSWAENDNLMNLVLFKQKEIEDEMRNIVEEVCMTSQIKWFLNCIPGEFSENFQFNKANEISINQDWILQLNGHVNGTNFSLRQNTKDENASLQTSTGLFKNGNDIDLSWKYKNSPFILPTSDQVFKVAFESLKSDDSLSKVQNQNDYFETLENLILKNIDKLYSKTEYTHNYIEHQIKSEEIVSKTKWILNHLWWVMPETLNWSSWKLFEFFDTICVNLGNMTVMEKESFLKCIEKLWERIRTEWNDSSRADSLAEDENLSKILGSKNQVIREIKREALTDEQKESKSLLDLFKPCFNGDLQKNLGILFDFLNNPKNNWKNIWELYPDIYYWLALSEAYNSNDIERTEWTAMS